LLNKKRCAYYMDKKRNKKVPAGDKGFESLKWEELCRRVNEAGEDPYAAMEDLGLDKYFFKNIPLAEPVSSSEDIVGLPFDSADERGNSPVAQQVMIASRSEEAPLSFERELVGDVEAEPIRISTNRSSSSSFNERRRRIDSSPTAQLFNLRINDRPPNNPGNNNNRMTGGVSKKRKQTRKKDKKKKSRITKKKKRKKRKNTTRKKKGGSDDDTDQEVAGILSSPTPSLSSRDEKELNKKRALAYNLYLLIDTYSPDTYISIISPGRGSLSISSNEGRLKKELIKQINKFSPETLDSAINEIETILRHNPSYPDLPEGYDMFSTREKYMAIREMRTNRAEDANV
jgi:hypothetical protein